MNEEKEESFFIKMMRRAGTFGRLFAVIFVCGCVIWCTIYSQNHKVSVYDISRENTETAGNETSTEEDSSDYLKEDESFEECYVMISNAGNKGRATTREPGNKKTVVKRLHNGTIVWAVKRGNYKGNSYYLLEDDTYLLDEDEYVLELKSYTRLAGYVNITLVSATGVKMRAWANFSDDNVVKRAFVGDQVKIKGKVVTKYGDEAYETEDGLYMTTNPEYYEDHTDEVGNYEGTGEQEEEDSFQ